MRPYHLKRFVFVAPALVLLQTQTAWGKESCDPSTEQTCSTAPLPLKAESKKELPLGLDTGWYPSCDNPAEQHCGSVQVRAWVRFTELDSGQPTYQIDMTKKPANVDARWKDDASGIEVSLAPGTTGGGTFKVSHGMQLSAAVYVDIGTPFEISVDVAQLLPLLPNGQPFNYIAVGNTQLTPLGFTKASMSVAVKDLESSELFEIDLKDLSEQLGLKGTDKYLTGKLSVNAISDSTFTYQTTSVKFFEAEGEISDPDGIVTVQGPFENSLELTANTMGVMRYSGKLTILPAIEITSVAGTPVGLTFPIDVGASVPYESEAVNVKFPPQSVKIPLPNIFVPSTELEFDTIEPGQQDEKKVTIENTGDLDGWILTIQSTSSAFVPGQKTTQIMSGESLDLPITFRPTKPGKYTGKIIVRSNDPDAPEQTFEVFGGQGAEIPPDNPDPDANQDPPAEDPGRGETTNTDGGCGCRAASTPPEYAMSSMALAGLGLFLSRRRSRR